MNFSFGKFGPLSIRQVYDIGWRPLHLINGTISSVGTSLVPAGLEKSIGLLSLGFVKRPGAPQWRDDPEMKAYHAWRERHYPESDPADAFVVAAYINAFVLVEIVRRCGDDLTRENVMRQARDLTELEPPLLLPGIRLNTSPTDHAPLEQSWLERFDGTSWISLGEKLGPDAESSP